MLTVPEAIAMTILQADDPEEAMAIWNNPANRDAISTVIHGMMACHEGKGMSLNDVAALCVMCLQAGIYMGTTKNEFVPVNSPS
jgi:hypothetical protein